MTINASTKLAAVLGFPAHHSLSPAMHNAAFTEAGINAVYLAFETPPETLRDMVSNMAAIGALGASVTTPHKFHVMAACTTISQEAKDIGAVNCLQFSQGHIIGHNTDGIGFVESLRSANVEVQGKKVVLLGSGGAAKALAAALGQEGAKISVIARTPTHVDWCSASPWTKENLALHLSTSHLVVDCTPIGLSVMNESKVQVPVPIEEIPKDSVFASLIYHRESAMMSRARACQLKVLGGLGMLLHQGAKAFSIWTGQPAPVDVMRSSLVDALKSAAID